MGFFDNALSSVTGGLVGGSGGSSALSGVIGDNVSSAIHDVSSEFQTGAALVGDYYTGGLSSALNPALSKGAQSNLNSPIGKVAQVGASLYGDYVGGGMTGASLPSQSAAPIFERGVQVGGGSMSGGTGGSIIGGAGAAGVGDTGGYGSAYNLDQVAATSPNQAYSSGANSLSSSLKLATDGSIIDSATGQVVSGAGTGVSTGTGIASALGGMSTAQKVALGLSGANTAMQLLSSKQKINTDPYGVGSASSATATSMLQKFNTGQLMPSDQAGIAQYQDQATAAAKDYYQKAGLGDSSMAQQAIAQVGVQANQMREAALNNMYSQAMKAAEISGTYAQSAVTQAVAQSNALMTAQSGFTNLMMQYGMNSGGQPVTKGTGEQPNN